MQETEVKYCVRSLSDVEVRLQQFGGHLLQERTHELNLRFDDAKRDLARESRVLRLRKDQAVRLTYKDNSHNIEGALSRREIEFIVDDFVAAREFIEALGYQVIFIYEKYRTTYEMDGSHIMLDELPYGDFVEIEGRLESLRPLTEQLDLDWDKTVPVSYHALFERLGRARSLKFRDLTFENFKEIKVSPADLMIDYADHQAMS
jgi:adenylate cyclase, class 2